MVAGLHISTQTPKFIPHLACTCRYWWFPWDPSKIYIESPPGSGCGRSEWYSVSGSAASQRLLTELISAGDRGDLKAALVGQELGVVMPLMDANDESFWEAQVATASQSDSAVASSKPHTAPDCTALGAVHVDMDAVRSAMLTEDQTRLAGSWAALEQGSWELDTVRNDEWPWIQFATVVESFETAASPGKQCEGAGINTVGHSEWERDCKCCGGATGVLRRVALQLLALEELCFRAGRPKESRTGGQGSDASSGDGSLVACSALVELGSNWISGWIGTCDENVVRQVLRRSGAEDYIYSRPALDAECHASAGEGIWVLVGGIRALADLPREAAAALAACSSPESFKRNDVYNLRRRSDDAARFSARGRSGTGQSVLQDVVDLARRCGGRCVYGGAWEALREYVSPRCADYAGPWFPQWAAMELLLNGGIAYHLSLARRDGDPHGCEAEANAAALEQTVPLKIHRQVMEGQLDVAMAANEPGRAKPSPTRRKKVVHGSSASIVRNSSHKSSSGRWRREGSKYVGMSVLRYLQENSCRKSAAECPSSAEGGMPEEGPAVCCKTGVLAAWMPAAVSDFVSEDTGQPAALWRLIYDSDRLTNGYFSSRRAVFGSAPYTSLYRRPYDIVRKRVCLRALTIDYA